MASLVLNVEFNLGEIVYLKTDLDQHPRIVNNYVVYATSVEYELVCVDKYTRHFETEISRNKIVF